MANKKTSFLAKLLIIIILLNLLILAVFLFWFYQEKIVKKPEPSPSPSTTPVIMPSVEPSVQPNPIPSPMPSPTPLPIPSVPTKTDLELIKEAFSKKYGKPLSEITVNISKQTGPYASGGVKFAGEMGGAMWLAYKGSKGWIIVHDGQGTISCEATDPYNFPVDMVPECFRESDGTIVERS